jgi:hypothetical protein
MKQVYDNCSIECESAEIISRRITPSSFVEYKKLGKCLTYNCKQNSEAKISKEVVPKDAVINDNSMLDLESKIECENMHVVVVRVKPYKLNVINHTGRHKAQIMKTDVFTFAKITRQHQNIPPANPLIEIRLVDDFF